MDLSIALAAVIVGYLAGSISFARLVGGFVAPGEDLAKTEVKEDGEKYIFTAVSATSISIRKGPVLGCFTSMLDMAKAAVPTLIFKISFPNSPYFLLTAAFAVVGHNWPIFYRFRGGRGLSPLIGGMLVIDWAGAFVANLIGMILGMALFRDVMLTYAGGAILIIPWLWYRTADWWHLAYALLVNLSFWTATIPDLRQYLRLRRRGVFRDFRQTMSITHAGRTWERIRNRLGLREETEGQ